MRQKAEACGGHVPPFLIASITQQCNLHCKGCYARANHSCYDGAAKKMLSAGQWEHIFAQAAGLGISFILLAGGEPFLRRDVLEAAGRQDGDSSISMRQEERNCVLFEQEEQVKRLLEGERV